MEKAKPSQMLSIRRAALGKPCAICGTIHEDIKKVVVDHDHGSGEIRGPICSWCNGMLGKVENAANRAKRGGTLDEWLDKALEWRRTARTGLMYPRHRTEADKKARAAKLRKAAAERKARAAITKGKA